MGCMKCGRETVSDQVFCPNCLEEMEKYPVRPGTLIHLPVHKTTSAAKKSIKKRTISPEEQVKILKKRCMILTIALMIVTTIATALVFPVVEHYSESRFKKGQNYSTIIPTEAK